MTFRQIKLKALRIKESLFRDSAYVGFFFDGVGVGLLFALPFTENATFGIIVFSAAFLAIGVFLIRLAKSQGQNQGQKPKMPLEPD
jgi:hypothetical protein